MNDSRPVLVCVDRSSAMPAAVRYAAVAALRLDRSLELLHVAPDHLSMAALAPLSAAPAAEGFAAVAEATLSAAEAVARDLLPAGRVTRVLVTGDRGYRITDASKDAVLVVLGDDREPTLDRMAFGSLIAEVAASSEVPVVTVPEGWSEPVSETLPPGGRATRRIVVGIKDDQRVPEELMLRAFELAHRQHAVLELVHVWDMAPVYGQVVASLMDMPAWSALVEDHLDAAATVARAAYPGVVVATTVTYGRPANVLRDISRRADLLLLARPRHDVLHHLGSTGRSVLRSVLCPVEVLPVLERAEPGQRGERLAASV